MKQYTVSVWLENGQYWHDANDSIVKCYRDACRMTFRLGAEKWIIRRANGTVAVNYYQGKGVVFFPDENRHADGRFVHLP